MKIHDGKKSYHLPQPQSISSSGSDSSSSIGSDEGGVDVNTVENFEDLLKICGDGWWQLRVFLLASYCGFLTALHNLVYAFIGASPKHWCQLPDAPGYGVDELKNLLIPIYKNGDHEQCKHYQYEYAAGNNGSKGTFMVNNNMTESCKIVDFDTSIFTSTIVTDFNLICGQEGWASVIQAIFMIGILFGSPIFGSFSDRFGRKRTTLIASVIFIIAGPLVALSPNFGTLMASRWLMGAASPGIYATSFVMAVESVSPGWRGLVGNLFCIPFAIGYMTLPGVAWFFRDWRSLQLVLSAPSLLQLIICWLSAESPRWLLGKGRVEEAEKVLRNAAQVNRRKLPINFSELVQKVAGVEKEIPVARTTCGQKLLSTIKGHASLFAYPNIRRRTLVLYICWMSISMVYYGVALNSPNLSADRYLYTFLSGVLELPSYFSVPPLIKYLGRRKVFAGFIIICGISLLSSLLFQQGSILIITLALVGKLMIGAAYALIYLYATECFPTLLRTFGTGSASMIGRIGSASAPFIVDLMGRDDKTIPTLVFGVVSLFAGMLSLLLPETKNKRLPETIEDVEND